LVSRQFLPALDIALGSARVKKLANVHRLMVDRYCFMMGGFGISALNYPVGVDYQHRLGQILDKATDIEVCRMFLTTGG
ncbi:hypothetical protein, partial [Alishewanella longhuensis]